MNLNFYFYKDEEVMIQKENITATKNETNISFLVEGMHHELDYKINHFKRENEEFCFNLDLQNKKSTYELKEKNILFDIEVEYLLFTENKKKYEMEYKLESDDSTNKIIIEII